MILLAVLTAGWVNPAAADWTEARCDIYAAGEDQASAMIPCTFGQRQGNVTITRSDGVTHDLVSTGDEPAIIATSTTGRYTGKAGSALPA
jgi:hypothetical protein